MASFNRLHQLGEKVRYYATVQSSAKYNTVTRESRIQGELAFFYNHRLTRKYKIFSRRPTGPEEKYFLNAAAAVLPLGIWCGAA